MGISTSGSNCWIRRSGWAALSVCVAGVCAQGAFAASADGGFVDRNAPIAGGRLFDLGVTDFDHDGKFEIFTVNHKFLGTLVEGRPGAWSDLEASSGFSPSPEFPGFEDLLHPPKPGLPGLYIYAESRVKSENADPEQDPLIHVVAKDVAGIPLLPEQAKGSITFPSPNVEVARQDGADVSVSHEGDPAESVVRFSVAEQGHIVLRVRKVDLPPIEVAIDQAPLLASTFVGAHEVPASSSHFTLRLIDRHGIAWTDANRDGSTDAFVVRGGLGGGIVDYIGRVFDELLINDGSGHFDNQIDSSGLRKGKCRSRHTAAIDYDADGLLDLFSSCKGGSPKLYRALPAGGYRGLSKPLGRVGAQGSDYRWAYLDGNRRPELLVATAGRIEVLRSSGVKDWKQAQAVEALNHARLVDSLAVGDYDADGDADVFVGAPSGNTLLVNHDGQLHPVDPGKVGLPRRGSGASWVDFDNDGRLDLHSMPLGLYRQGADGSFSRTGFAAGKRSSLWSIADWFDFDNDGDRDVATAIRTVGGKARVQTRLLENTAAGNHWLELDLSGPPGNLEAVGARVRVRAAGRTQTGWVGQSDGSRYSQGQYRLYFGLGDTDAAKRVSIRWPGGRRTKLRDVAADQILELTSP